MIDIREKDGSIPEMDRFFLGEYIAKLNLNKWIKTAVIAKKEQINKFSETVAQNRGAQLYISSTEEDAYEWLLSDKAI